MNKTTCIIICIIMQVFHLSLKAQTIVEQKTSKLFHVTPSGKVVYMKDIKGNQLPDFSYVGFHSGEKPSLMQGVPIVHLQLLSL